MSSLVDTGEKTMSQTFRHSVTDATPTKALGMTPTSVLFRDGLNDKLADCIFCTPGSRKFIAENELAFALADNHPVTSLHTLIVPRRHAPTYFDLHDPERRAINLLLDHVRFTVLAADKTVEGFNVGMNCGGVAGQTVMHCHVHLIPRRQGDVDQPRGGVRAVIPGKAAY